VWPDVRQRTDCEFAWEYFANFPVFPFPVFNAGLPAANPRTPPMRSSSDLAMKQKMSRELFIRRRRRSSAMAWFGAILAFAMLGLYFYLR
jgi:hypothetical protein